MEFLLAIGVAMFAGLFLSRLTSRFNLPDVTSYLVAGLLIGPLCLGRLGVPGLGFTSFDFVDAMGWADDQKLVEARRNGIERQLFPDLSDDEMRIVQLLETTNDLRQDAISVKTGLPMATTLALLFQLEMKGVVKPYAGGVYHLLA